MTKAKGETDHCRDRLTKYCQGQGVDLGCGATKIKVDAIGVDLYHPNADMRKDARIMNYFPDKLFDYVYSAHLLEEIENTEATLREWLRILKDGGYLVLYQADKDLYYPMGDPQCNPGHKHHFSWEDLWTMLEKIGGVELIHHARYTREQNEWSFEIVVRKKGIENQSVVTPVPPIPAEVINPNDDEGISILIPTRGRPQNIEDFVQALDKTTSNPTKVEILFGVDEDDSESKEKITGIQSKVTIKYEVLKKYHDGKINLSYFWNQLYAKSSYDIVGFFGDDVLFRTEGWDIEVRKEFLKDKTVMVSCNDLHIQRGRTSILFFTHKFVHEKLGFYMNEKLRRWYIDTFLDIIYRNNNKVHYREDLVTEHFNPASHPERNDAIFEKLRELVDTDKAFWTTEENRNDLKKGVACLKSIGSKNIISFSLWGTEEKYLVGALKNSDLARVIYPGWICRYYVDTSIPETLIKSLQKNGAEVIVRESCGYKALFWRFEPAFDSTVGRFIVRDCDSRLNTREKEAVDEWIKSDKPFHCMRDHAFHTLAIHGAMWGAKAFFLSNFKKLYLDFLKNIDDQPVVKRERYFLLDEIFLNDHIWPKIKAEAIVHDDLKRITGAELPFKRKLPNDQFVGQQWGTEQPLTNPI